MAERAHGGGQDGGGVPLVSVIVPYHRTPAAFFREAIGSVLEQTVGDLELLLVDDAASDEAREVARDAVKRDPARVRRVVAGRETPAGISAARNAGLAAARGEFLALLDSDDVWETDKLRAQVAALRGRPAAAMAYGDTLYWHSWAPQPLAEDFVPRAGFPAGTRIEPPQLLARSLDGRAAVPCPCSVLVRTQAARDVGGWVDAFTGMYEDQVFYARIAAELPVVFTGGVRDRYRQHPDSCCATAYRDDRERAARARYLDWLATWLDERGIGDPSLRRIVWRERMMVRYPRLGRVARGVRSLSRRVASRAGAR